MGRKKSLTKEQVLKAIRNWLIQHGMAPTVEELRRILRVGSSRTVLRYLQWLEVEGDIERWPGARGLRLLRSPRKGLETVLVPLVGEAPAGPLMAAEENIDGWVQIPRRMAPDSSRYFLLRVHGNSMNRARVRGNRIEDGDLVLVRQQPAAGDGEIVIAHIDDEATIKRLVRQPGYFVLKPESTDAKHRPIVVDRDFRVQGVAVQVLKKGSAVID
jgi:repressor LexA